MPMAYNHSQKIKALSKNAEQHKDESLYSKKLTFTTLIDHFTSLYAHRARLKSHL